MLTPFTTFLLAVSGFAAVAGCGTQPAEGPPDGDPLAWESSETTTDDGAVVIQKVSYRVGGLRIFGQICRPAQGGPFPLIVANHGGASGLGPEWNAGLCRDSARNGAVQIESAYRGEDGSDGHVEICDGEVDDVLRMLDIALTLPEVDPARVVMWGESHGGCVTTRAAMRGAPIAAAADVFGIADFTSEYAFWRSQLAAGTGPTANYQGLIDLANNAMGGPPEQFPEAYERRSTVLHAAELPAGLPFVIAQGVADPLVPPVQSCRLAKELGMAGHHYDATHTLVTTVPAGCEGIWTAATTPVGAFAADRYFLAYDGLGHVLDGTQGTAMVTDVGQFLLAKIQ